TAAGQVAALQRFVLDELHGRVASLDRADLEIARQLEHQGARAAAGGFQRELRLRLQVSRRQNVGTNPGGGDAEAASPQLVGGITFPGGSRAGVPAGARSPEVEDL